MFYSTIKEKGIDFMYETIITAIASLLAAIITGWFTSRSKNKEIDLLKDKNEKEIESLKEKHQHEKDKLLLMHQHELTKIEKEVETQLELKSQTGIDNLMQNQFAKQLEDPNSLMSTYVQELMQNEINKHNVNSNKNNIEE